MNEKEANFIRSRIDAELKMEFGDIYPNMSVKLIEMIQEAIENAKEKYLFNTIDFFSNKKEQIDILEGIIEKIYQISKTELTDHEGIKVLSKIEKEYGIRDSGTLEAKVYGLVYRDMINGLYKGKSKDSFQDKVERLYRNKEKVLNYIKLRLIGW